ncbi:hypothetical protein S4A8_08145 [Salinisphaera sp. S4-8]|uniref:PepSY domain-containing protein n=1 Tax=Salinisphaera sp. S4-8 TaxID=633357 RepID=UPI00333F8F10
MRHYAIDPDTAWAGLRLAVALLVLLTCPIALAQFGSDALRAPLAEGAGPGRSAARDVAGDESRPPPNVAPAEAARRAAREYGGRVLNVVLEDGPGGPYYRVKLLDGGRVRIVHVEARH